MIDDLFYVIMTSFALLVLYRISNALDKIADEMKTVARELERAND
jgi:hypothetical protein